MDFFRAGEPLGHLPGAVDNTGLDHFRAGETFDAVIPVAALRVVRVLGDDAVWYRTDTHTVKVKGDDLVWYPIGQALVFNGSAWVSLT